MFDPTQFSQEPQQNSGVIGILQDPSLMLGLALMNAGNSKDPSTAAFNALSQVQQAQQFRDQQQMQQQELALRTNEYLMKLNEAKRQSQAGTQIADSVFGEAASPGNNFQSKGLIGKSDIVADNPLYSPNSVFNVPSKMATNTLDPVTRAKYEGYKIMAASGQADKALQGLPEYPKPFALSPGQQQFTPDGKMIAENQDTQKIFNQENTLREQHAKTTEDFQKIGDAYANVLQGYKNPTGPNQKMILNQVIKMQFPAGNTVREGQYINLKNNEGLSDVLVQAWNQMVDGKTLTPQQMAEIKNVADGIYLAQRQRYDLRTKDIQQKAIDYGLNPDRVINIYDKKSDNSQSNEPQAKTQYGMQNKSSSSGKHFVFTHESGKIRPYGS